MRLSEKEGKAGRCPEEMRNSSRLSLFWNTSEISLESLNIKLAFCCLFLAKQNKIFTNFLPIATM